MAGRQVQRSNDNRKRDEPNPLVVSASRMPMPKQATALGYDQGQWRALTDAIFPSAKSVDGVLLALRYCKARRLDPFKKVCHIVPIYSSALGRMVESVWPGIADHRITATRTGVWAGTDECEFGPILEVEYAGTQRWKQGDSWNSKDHKAKLKRPEWARITVHKIVAGHRVAFVGPKVLFDEMFSEVARDVRVPNEKWQKSPQQMLEKCAEAASLRRAFPEELGSEWTAEEMEGKTLHGEISGDRAVDSLHDGGDDGVVDAEVQEIDGEQDGRAEEGQAADAEGAAREADDTRKRYVRNAIKSIEGAATIEVLDRMLDVEGERLSRLPDRDQKKVEDAVSAARERLHGGRNDLQDKADLQAGASAKNTAASGENGGNDLQDPSDEQQDVNPPYVRNFMKRLNEIELVYDINQFEKSERRSIDAQEADVKAMLDKALDDRRQQVAPK